LTTFQPFSSNLDKKYISNLLNNLRQGGAWLLLTYGETDLSLGIQVIKSICRDRNIFGFCKMAENKTC
jgi:hypothetical protein